MSPFRFVNTDIAPDVTHRRLPHWEQPEVCYFLTFRTADSLPANVASLYREKRLHWLQTKGIHPTSPTINWQELISKLAPPELREYQQEFSREFHHLLDAGYGACVLRQQAARQCLGEVIQYADGSGYFLGDYVIMPNHVHLLAQMHPGNNMKSQVQIWKRFSARRINALLGRSGAFWQGESYDRIVRSAAEFEHYRSYIQGNPVKAKLPEGDYCLHTSKWI
jgi:putative transposase